MNTTNTVHVQVVCATRDRHVLRSVDVEPLCTIADAVRISGVLDEFPQLDPHEIAFAVYGKAAPGTQWVCEGDRIELLRALEVDPREARRRRAQLRERRKAPLP